MDSETSERLGEGETAYVDASLGETRRQPTWVHIVESGVLDSPVGYTIGGSGSSGRVLTLVQSGTTTTGSLLLLWDWKIYESVPSPMSRSWSLGFFRLAFILFFFSLFIDILFSFRLLLSELRVNG